MTAQDPEAPIRITAAYHRLGLATGPELVEAADAAMLAGVESPSLVLLAGETNPALDDAAPLFEQALAKLGVPMPSTREACLLVVADRLQRAVVGEESASEAVLFLHYHHVRSAPAPDVTEAYLCKTLGLGGLIEAAWELDAILESPECLAAEGKTRDELRAGMEAELLDLARAWLAQHADEAGATGADADHA